MDRLECDRMFVTVMDAGSFTKAAAKLGTSSGQASKLVARLEAELGVRLLNRTTRAVSPTEAGRAYYERLRRLLDEYDNLDLAVRNISQTPRGQLRITAPVTFGTTELASVLAAFASVYPEIALDVSFSDRLVNVVEEGFDVAIRVGKPVDSTLIARRLCDVRVMAVASDAYIAAHGAPSTPADLSQHVCIIDTNFRDPNRWPFQRSDGEMTAVPVNGRLRFSNAEACLRAAELGLGIAYVPGFVAMNAVASGALRRVLEARGAAYSIFALYPHSRHLATNVRVLIDFLAEHFRGAERWSS